MAKSDRRGRIIELYNAGSTLAEIGCEFGLTRERVRQLFNQYRVEKRRRADRCYESAFPARADEVEALFLQLRDDDAVVTRPVSRRAYRFFVPMFPTGHFHREWPSSPEPGH